ncbi:CPCC family cysteine-rich protein [Tepidibacter hydrothermalis]|uniref:CPCC family cysteine-rich protein n=1 Tax=Tepidibacter hydrothermalis TaxID=3036126 RepID=A0ABY8E712_9FIRM|nr:CPCC family cysteine-rich protein [Tepidibacter hydrothermalis]WFD08681.1 CPCC family cysteine-rich protein [Tepidibacter hydrothermalis]
MRKDRTMCPCCGNYTFSIGTEKNVYLCGSICPVCYWEIDPFVSDDEEPSDSNHGLSLKQAKENYKTFGACIERLVQYVRKANDNEK